MAVLLTRHLKTCSLFTLFTTSITSTARVNVQLQKLPLPIVYRHSRPANGLCVLASRGRQMGPDDEVWTWYRCSFLRVGTTQSMADRIGQQLGNYTLLRLLGRGGQAEV